jgi:hypothetical protein
MKTEAVGHDGPNPRYKTEVLGYVELSDKVIVSDPGYDRGLWCMKTDFPVKSGRYKAQVVYIDDGDFGVYVSGIMLVHEEYEQMQLTGWEDVDADIGIDNGQCGIFDDAIYPQTENHPDNEPFYDECCELTMGEKQAGLLKSRRGIVSSGGYGDGLCALRTISQDGEHVAMMLEFIVLVDED